ALPRHNPGRHPDRRLNPLTRRWGHPPLADGRDVRHLSTQIAPIGMEGKTGSPSGQVVAVDVGLAGDEAEAAVEAVRHLAGGARGEVDGLRAELAGEVQG